MDHSDQGSPYVSLIFGQRCGDAGLRISMGSQGDADDNAVAESFFASLEKDRGGRPQPGVDGYEPVNVPEERLGSGRLAKCRLPVG